MTFTGAQLEDVLKEFEENTEGILGTTIIDSQNALTLAEASSSFDREVLQGMSERLLQTSINTLEALVSPSSLTKVVLEDDNHFVFVRPITINYFLVVISEKIESLGLLEFNCKSLVEKLSGIMM